MENISRYHKFLEFLDLTYDVLSTFDSKIFLLNPV